MKDSSGITKAQTWFTYTVEGNLETKTSWLNGGTNPVTTYTYDSYGNVKIITDPKQNPPTTITYDTTTHTYPETIQNPLGHTTQMTYDLKFGKLKTSTDPNGNTITYDYDEFGRLKKVTNPAPYGITEYLYQNYGDPYNQRVREEAKDQYGTLILWKETYFDGLGRTTSEKQGGPSATTIIVDTEYNEKGLVYRKSYPYYNGDTVYKITYTYDPVDRLTQILNPDGTYSTISYERGRITYIDANGHKKVAEKDIYERIIKIEEYSGVSPSNTLYATTTYAYDVLDNLTYVRDEYGNETVITYDSLSRKTSMDDPDMGFWEYNYDLNSNLTYQKDAKLQEITFEYDEINRVTKKNYPDATYIEYRYDEAFSTNPLGRLTTLIDPSGTTKFYYDEAGQISKTIKTIDSTDYTTQTQYDALGKIEKVVYPDSTEIDYTYDGNGNIKDIKSGSQTYITYTSYTALGQPLSVTYGNGVTTIYQYYADNNRLFSITTNNQATGLMNVAYYYDDIGNITNITDLLDSSKTRDFKYDDLDRLIEADSPSYGGKLIYQYDKIGNMTYNCRYGYYYYDDPNHVHAVTRIEKNGTTIDSYAYDDNGNMISGAGRDFTYDYDNRPTSIVYNSAATVSVYDAFGNRVKKAVPLSTTIYIGQIYECEDGICTKYIFAGMQRIANIKGTDTYYYHTDHLGSSSIITDKDGNTAQDIYYYPYGEIKTNTGSDIAKHKFTGQEYDAETGLYYYGARYYDPKLARFVSADTIVPDPINPQSLNRYSYVINNPLRYIDPSGHSFWDDVGEFFDDAWDWIEETVEDIGDWLGEHVNVNVYVSTNVAAFGSGGGSPGNSSWIKYTGPGSGNQSAFGDPGSISGGNILGYATDNGITLYMTFYLRYSDQQYNVQTIRDSINRAMYPSTYHKKKLAPKAPKKVDWISTTLGGISSVSSLVALGAPVPQVKLVAGIVGVTSTGLSVLFSIYQYQQGEMSRNELALRITLDVTPMLGKGGARIISKKIYEAVGGGFDVMQHQIGTGEVIYETIIKPNK